MMEGFSLAPKEIDRRWSASERAQRVVRDDRLHALLSDEIKTSGFLTSAGHATVVQKFLHSDAVDKEMTKARDGKPPEGLFRRLVSSDGTSHGAGASLAGATPSRARSRSSNSLFSLFSSDTSIDADVAAELAADADRVGNIAPRRLSQDKIQFEYAPNIDIKLLEEQFSLKANVADDDPGTQDTATAANDAETAEKEDEQGGGAERPSFAFVNACAEGVLQSLRRAHASEARPRPKRRDDDGRSVRSDRSDEDSDADEGGWLPWPEQRD